LYLPSLARNAMLRVLPAAPTDSAAPPAGLAGRSGPVRTAATRLTGRTLRPWRHLADQGHRCCITTYTDSRQTRD
jgi:hypothetical protein